LSCAYRERHIHPPGTTPGPQPASMRLQGDVARVAMAAGRPAHAADVLHPVRQPAAADNAADALCPAAGDWSPTLAGQLVQRSKPADPGRVLGYDESDYGLEPYASRAVSAFRGRPASGSSDKLVRAVGRTPPRNGDPAAARGRQVLLAHWTEEEFQAVAWKATARSDTAGTSARTTRPASRPTAGCGSRSSRPSSTAARRRAARCW
jgi:hypothetical protein